MKINEAGYTLLEVVVSLLLSAIMVGAVMSVALTAKHGSVKSDNKTIAAQETRRLSAELKAFVTSYYDYSTAGWSANVGSIGGPANPGTPGTASWQWASMTGADGANPISDSCRLAPTYNSSPPCYALAAGVHNLTNYMKPEFEGAPTLASATYSVTTGVDFGSGNLRAPEVKVNIYWSDQ